MVRRNILFADRTLWPYFGLVPIINEEAMTLSDTSYRPRSVKRQIPRHLGLLVLLFDVLALLAAFATTTFASQLLVMLSALVEAERDLEHFDIWDIATAHWLRDAGRSRFLLTAPPLRLPGAVGSPATPIATV